MKIPSTLNRLKSITKQLKGTRLIVSLAILAVVSIGATSVAAYTTSLQRKKVQVAEEVQKKTVNSAPKVVPTPPAVAAENPTAPTNPQPTPTPKATVAPTQPTDPRLKPITVQIGWWGGAYLSNDQDAQVVNFGSTSIRVIGFVGGELHWQAEANIDGGVSVINAGSATLAPKQMTYDIPQFVNRQLPYVAHGGDIMLRVHVTSPNDVVTEWRTISSGTF